MAQDITWINRDADTDDDFYKAVLQIVDLCKAQGISLVGVVVDRHQNMADEDTSRVKITSLCSLEDGRLALPLAEAAREHVLEKLTEQSEQMESDDVEDG